MPTLNTMSGYGDTVLRALLFHFTTSLRPWLCFGGVIRVTGSSPEDIESKPPASHVSAGKELSREFSQQSTYHIRLLV